ncbi:uncharacterized protein BX663DRAFT_515896 [Cokeromyces recurvatus]|uniref:uncharacterized protein n=1 Tax=Cokeromyces recurvatus TaxID=90255 RepID=UPI00221ECA49|nr:uncharacterized protein BX663DRAFT_515896 [Cokeromyces recurvatus]KAI7900976.1 hypothetical protein BX663DRAFT_515896 [Cokeromyces recurvatus]
MLEVTMEHDDTMDAFKPIELKGESESDKDLIIDSLSESLTIHKDIVERIQNETDELQYRYETLEKPERQYIFEQEKQRIQEEQQEMTLRLERLEHAHKALVDQLEAKEIEYQRMESRFQSHVQLNGKDASSLETSVRDVLSDIHELCVSLEVIDKKELEQMFGSKEIIWKTEKWLVDKIVNKIWKTPIHPGIPLNNAFEKVHKWIERRNVAWATRIKQHLVGFMVKESSQETNIARAKLIEEVLKDVEKIYLVNKKVKEKWEEIVDKALELNVLLKCEDVTILNIEEGTAFNKHIMTNVNKQDGKIVEFVISPPFVASNAEKGFLVQAQVYCV